MYFGKSFTSLQLVTWKWSSFCLRLCWMQYCWSP